MKLAIFTAEFPPYPGGIATYSYEIAAAGQRLGHEVSVFAFAPAPTPSPHFEVASCRPYGFKTYEFPLASLGVQGILARRRFDLVFAADLNNIVACAPVITRGEKRAAVHGTDVQSKFLTRYLARVGYHPLLSYARIFANSRFTRDLLFAAHPNLAADRCEVATLGVDRFWFETPAAEERAAVSLRLGSLAGRFVAVAVGRLERRKGQVQAIEAVSRLPERIRDNVTLLIVGRVVEADYAAEIAAAAAAAKADVRLLGDIPRPELRALYAASNLLVHSASQTPGRIEGFGLVLLEAAAAGTPAVATRVDALPEVVADGATGLLVEDRDIDGLANAIARAYGEDLKAKFGERCRTSASQHTWDRCARVAFAT